MTIAQLIAQLTEFSALVEGGLDAEVHVWDRSTRREHRGDALTVGNVGEHELFIGIN